MNTLAKRFVHIAAWLALALTPAASRAADGSPSSRLRAPAWPL